MSSLVDAPRRRAVFWDRDGVLNESVCVNGVTLPPPDAAAMRFIPGAADAVAMLRAEGWLCIGVTNQPDVARGTRTEANVDAMNARAVAELGLDDMYVCLHDNADDCACRKPKPGMVLAAAEKWNIDRAISWMVGDRESDIEAGRAGGCRTMRIATGNITTAADIILPDAMAAARFIIAVGA